VVDKPSGGHKLGSKCAHKPNGVQKANGAQVVCRNQMVCTNQEVCTNQVFCMRLASLSLYNANNGGVSSLKDAVRLEDFSLFLLIVFRIVRSL